jgi:hypothetical protein
MITFFGTLIRIFFHAFRSKRIILSENALLKKENDILLRRIGKKRVHFNIYDKLFFNSQRPHQGIQQQIPKPGEPEKIGGPVCMSSVLGGLHHHYYRQAA